MSTTTIETSTKSKRPVSTPRASGEKAKASQKPRSTPAAAKAAKPAEAQREERITKQERLLTSTQSAGGRQHRRNDAGHEVAAA